MRAAVVTAGLALALATPLASAQPRITAPVTDLADALPAEQEQQLTQKLTNFRAASGVAVAVVVVPTTGAVTLEAYSMRVATAWREDLLGATNAVLYVLAVRDRRHRLEVNDGARPRLTDARAQQALDAARPSLRTGDYGGAVRLVMDAVLTTLAPAAAPAQTITEEPAAPPAPAPPAPPAPAPTASPSSATSEGEKVCFGLFCLLSLLLGAGLLVSLVVAAIYKAGKAVSQVISGTTYGHGGASHFRGGDAHDHGSAWAHDGGHDHDTSSSFASSDTSSFASSDTSSSSSSDTSSSGGGFSGGGASSDW